MELNHLRAFHEVAKSGSFTEAARRLHISQSALSKAVASLEDSEGVKLFKRSKRGVSLTDVGSEVFRLSTSIFHAVGEIENTCRGKKDVREGPLRFGASDHVASYLLVEEIQKMREEFSLVIPSVFSGAPSEIVGRLLANDIEFGLFFTRVPSPLISYDPIAELEMVVVCHPRLVRDAGKPSKAELRRLVNEFGFIGSIGADYQHHPSEALNIVAGGKLGTTLEANSQEMQKRLCLAGAGVAYLARFMVEKEIREKRLHEVQGVKPLPLQLLLAKRKGLALSLSAQTLQDRITSRLRGSKT